MILKRKKRLTNYDIDLEIVRRVVNDPGLPERGTVEPIERVRIFYKLVSKYREEVVDEYNRGVLEV